MKALFYGPFLAIFAVTFLSSSTVWADSDNSALLIGIDGCVLLDGNTIPQAASGSGVTLETQSHNGNAIHICTTTVEPPASGHAAVYNYDSIGVLCGLDDPNAVNGNIAITEDWHEVVSASGQAKLVCNFHGAE